MSLVPLKTNVSPTQSLYAPASGGGGGGGGPNLNVSSINVNPDGGITLLTDAFGDAPQVAFNTSADGSTGEQFLFRDAEAGNLSDGGRFLALQYFSPGPVVAGILGVRGLNFSPQFQGEVGAGVIGVATGGTSIYLEGVSTINGAVPGGGGSSGSIAVSSITSFPGQANPSTILVAAGPGGNLAVSGYPVTQNPGGDILLDTGISANALAASFQPGGPANAALLLSPAGTGTNLNLGATDTGGALLAAVDGVSGAASTLTVVSENVQFLDPGALGPTLNIGASDTNLYDINTVSSSVALAGLSIGFVGGRNQVYMDVAQVPNFFTSTITGATGVIALNPSGTEQIRIGGTGSPGDITINTVGGGLIKLNGPTVMDGFNSFTAPNTATISSLTVSSINGQMPGGGGLSVQKLNWLNAGTNTLPANGTPGTFVPLTGASAAVTNGHTYRVTANFGLSNTVASGATDIVIEGAGIGGLPAIISSSDNIVTGANVPFAGLSGYFTVAGTSGGGVTVSGVNTGTANTTVFGDNAFVLLEDLGAI